MFSSLSLLVLVSLAKAHLEVFDTRSYVCRRKAQTGLVDCRLSFGGNEEWDAINDNGCYQEAEPESQSVIEWCPLQCQDSPRAYVTENISSQPTGCDSESFGVLRRKNDWFLWRVEPCDQQDAVFRVACTQPGAPKKHPKFPMEKVVKEEKVEVEQPVKEDNINDTLPETVDAILKAMLPAYRNSKQ